MIKNTGIKWGLAGLMTLVLLVGIAVMTTAALAHEAEDSGLAGQGRERTFTSPLPSETPHPEKTETPEVGETPETEHETPEPRHTSEPEVHTPEPAHSPDMHAPEPQHTPEPEHQAPKDDRPSNDTGRDDHQEHSGKD